MNAQFVPAALFGAYATATLIGLVIAALSTPRALTSATVVQPAQVRRHKGGSKMGSQARDTPSSEKKGSFYGTFRCGAAGLVLIPSARLSLTPWWLLGALSVVRPAARG